MEKRKQNFKWVSDLKRGEILVKDCELRFYTGRTDENVENFCKFIGEDPWSTVESGYNDIGLCDTSYIRSDILRYQLIPYY